MPLSTAHSPAPVPDHPAPVIATAGIRRIPAEDFRRNRFRHDTHGRVTGVADA